MLMCDTADGGGFYDCGNIIISHGIIISCIFLRPLLFNVFINYRYDAVAHSNDFKIYRTVKSP